MQKRAAFLLCASVVVAVCMRPAAEAQKYKVDDPVPPGWEAHPVGLEELALAYLREPEARALPGPRGRVAEPSEVAK